MLAETGPWRGGRGERERERKGKKERRGGTEEKREKADKRKAPESW